MLWVDANPTRHFVRCPIVLCDCQLQDFPAPHHASNLCLFGHRHSTEEECPNPEYPNL